MYDGGLKNIFSNYSTSLVNLQKCIPWQCYSSLDADLSKTQQHVGTWSNIIASRIKGRSLCIILFP